MKTQNSGKEVIAAAEVKIQIDLSQCVIARGSPDTWGYGRIKIKQKEFSAHRLSYLLFNGPIIEPFQVDHICRNRKCINPNHLRLVTVRENVLSGIGEAAQNYQKTICKRGHKFTDENIYRQPSRPNHRNCRKCRTIHAKSKGESL